MRSPTEIRKQSDLKERRAVLEAKVAELTGAFQDRSELAVVNSADVLDTIRMATDRDVLVQRMNMSARVLSDVRKAIAALDNGEYGICEDCAEPIAARRLDVMPWASVCVKCQEARDRSDTEKSADDFSAAA